MSAETVRDRLSRLSLELPAPPLPQGDYRPVIVHAGIAYVSGQVSRLEDGVVRGPLTSNTDPATLALATRACVLRAVSALQSELGDLEAIDRILFVRGFVFADAAFERHSLVLDEVSALFAQIFGKRGEHARSAVGVSSLPSGGMLEIEVTAALR